MFAEPGINVGVPEELLGLPPLQGGEKSCGAGQEDTAAGALADSPPANLHIDLVARVTKGMLTRTESATLHTHLCVV